MIVMAGLVPAMTDEKSAFYDPLTPNSSVRRILGRSKDRNNLDQANDCRIEGGQILGWNPKLLMRLATGGLHRISR